MAVLGICLTSITHLDFKFLNYIKFSGVIYTIVLYVWGNIYFLTFIYFCMVIGKVALRNKRLGKIGSFILFIALTLQNPHIVFFPINISKLVFDILTFVALFKATAYMIDNKLDL